MKKIFEILVLFFLSVSLCSCPYSSAYNIDETAGIYVEDVLLGKWLAMVKSSNGRDEPVIVHLSRKTDTEYNITFTGYLEDLRRFNVVTADSITGTAFMSTINGMQFFNISINSRIYIAELKLKNNNLSLLPLAEHFTNKMIFSSEALRKSVDVHYKTRVHPVFDENFCLKNMAKLD
ncbi:MAG: hypothetical protein WBP16_01165 [Ferruginibacter sp.]